MTLPLQKATGPCGTLAPAAMLAAPTATPAGKAAPHSHPGRASWPALPPTLRFLVSGSEDNDNDNNYSNCRRHHNHNHNHRMF